jgi:putative nucleotidyltransferase with HDIG domain
MIDLDTLIRSAYALAPLPSSVTRLAAIIAADEWSADEIEEVITLDPALTANLLRLANSAAFGSRGTITSVRHAVVRLGVGSVLSLAVAASVQSRVDRPVPEYGLSSGELWRHSVISALVAEQARPYCRLRVPPEAYTAALLHDIGKLVVARFLDAETRELLGHAREQGALTRVDAESEVLGVHHGEIGGLVAQHWSLPESIAEGIQHHHAPGRGLSSVCHVVHLANAMAHRIEESEPSDGVGPDALGRETLEALGLDADDLPSLEQDARPRIDQILAEYA